MGLPADSSTWKGIKSFDDPKVLKNFLNQLVGVINSIASLNYILGLLNASNGLLSTALKYVRQDFIGATTNQTLDCSGAVGVFVKISIGANVTLALKNLTETVPVFIQASGTSATTFTLKITATNGSGTAYSVMYDSSGTLGNFATTGIALSTTVIRGCTGSGDPTGPLLQFIVV
jgi:hypothetical protein